jgi:hypothetical protein
LDYVNQVSSALLNDKLIRGENGIGLDKSRCSCNLHSISNRLCGTEQQKAWREDAGRFLSCNCEFLAGAGQNATFFLKKNNNGQNATRSAPKQTHTPHTNTEEMQPNPNRKRGLQRDRKRDIKGSLEMKKEKQPEFNGVHQATNQLSSLVHNI